MQFQVLMKGAVCRLKGHQVVHEQNLACALGCTMLQKLSKCEVKAENEFLQVESLVLFGNSFATQFCVKSILKNVETLKLSFFAIFKFVLNFVNLVILTFKK